ncbi:MAG: YggT family protein [Bacteriovoracaceae bacterium]|nr:YggT family protein [Bacteriovoracaceae bacterium]
MIRFVLYIYILVLFVDAALSYFPSLNKEAWRLKIKLVADFTLDPIRKVLPADLPFDISPIIAFVVIQLIMALW